MDTFVIGDVVEIKPEWIDSGESAGTEYIVVDVNYETKRCYIQPVKSDLPIAPQSLVSFEMITLLRESEAVAMIKKQQKRGRSDLFESESNEEK